MSSRCRVQDGYGRQCTELTDVDGGTDHEHRMPAIPARGRPDVDPPGTCHLVGCPGKGTVDKHTAPGADRSVPVRIGCGQWEDYTRELTVRVRVRDLEELLADDMDAPTPELQAQLDQAIARIQRVLAQHRNDMATRAGDR